MSLFSKTLSRHDFTKQFLTGVGSLFLGHMPKQVNRSSSIPGWIGYTEYRTNLPGGRQANAVTSQACLVRADGHGRRVLLPHFGERPFSWTQFGGWSPNGDAAVISCGWEDPANAAWEEEHKEFRMTQGWRLDTGLFNLKTGHFTNLTAIERISEYNSGLFFWPNDESKLGFTALINGISHPFSMDRNGRNKTDLLNGPEGFTYGFNVSPDGKRIAYHKEYKVYIADANGSNEQLVETGNPFNFCPQWSKDGQWLLFLSGEHYDCHPYLVRSDATDLHKIADRGDYSGVTAVLDVPDYHGGSSDIPVWSDDSRWIYYTALCGTSVELMRVSVNGQVERLTFSTKLGTLHYHPRVSPDGTWLLCGSNRSGRRQLHLLPCEGGDIFQVTHVPDGWGAMWGFWQPSLTQQPIN